MKVFLCFYDTSTRVMTQEHDRCFSFFFWALCCLYFFNLLFQITPLVSSSNSTPTLKNAYIM